MEGQWLSDDLWSFMLGFMERALETRPELASIATDDGTMLHTACKLGAPTDVIRALLNAYPEAAKTHNEDGALPLDSACRADDVCLESVGMLLDHYSEGVALTSYTESVPGEPSKRVRRERTTVLSNALYFSDDGESKTELVLFLLERCPESASVTCNGYLPLHDACESHAPIEIIRRLIKAYPLGVRERSVGTGNLPLHCACRGSEATLEVVRLLMAQYPESTRIQDGGGSLPIHIACQFHGTPLEVSWFLFNSYQDGARVQNNDGWLPLHYASNSGSLEIGRLLLEHYPSGARVRKRVWALPMHFSCDGRIFFGGEACLEAKGKLTRAMLRCYPDGIRTADNFGQLPLHWACCGHEEAEPVGWGTRFLRHLIELYPNAIRHTDSKGRLPLHLSIAMHRGLDHIRLLIEYNLNTVLCKTGEGKTPLQLLYPHGDDQPYDPEIKAFLIEKQDEALRAVREAVEAATEEQLSRLLPDSSFDLVIAKIWELAQPALWEPPN